MRISRLALAFSLGISAIALSGCATGLPVKVSRYQAMPAPQGQTFVVVPMNARNAGGLEFSRYAAIVAQGLQAQGYRPAASLNQATMIARLDYGVDEGQEVIERDPFYNGYYPYGFNRFGGFYSRPYYSRYGFYGARSPFYYGWDDPYFGGYGGYGARSYTVYQSFLDLDIRRKADNAALFEGHAKARSQTDNLGTLVPNLAEALFTGFPGRSGETVKITVPPPARR